MHTVCQELCAHPCVSRACMGRMRASPTVKGAVG